MPVHSTTFTITVTAPPKPDLTPLGAKGAEPGPNAPVADRINPDGTYVIAGGISFKVQPKNIGAGTTKLFNLKLQKKLHDNPAISPRHPDSEYADTGDVVNVSDGLSDGMSVDRLIEYAPLISDTDQNGYDFRYCVDLPKTDLSNGQIEGNVLESNENNNCSGPLSPPVTFNQAQISPLTISCSVSPNAVDMASNPNQNVTWTANPSGGTAPYSYLWVGNDQTLAGKITKDVTFSYNPATTARDFKKGSVTVTDSLNATASTGETGCVNGVSVSNSNDDFELLAGPIATINFIGQSAVSNRVPITVGANEGFNSPVTISASGLVGAVSVEYIFYKHGTSDKVTTIASNDYGTGLDMVIKASKFIAMGSYPNAVTVHGKGGGKSDDAQVRVDVNDSRPKFQEF